MLTGTIKATLQGTFRQTTTHLIYKRDKMSTTDIEKENLEAHVELCAERYKNLENKLSNLDSRMTKVEEHLVAIRETITEKSGGSDKTIITIGTTIFAAMMSAVVVLLVNYINK
jgi:hypothetical protein